MNKLKKSHRLDALVAMTDGAYSQGRYGPTAWRMTIKALMDDGYTDREINAIMRSKWTRWALDATPESRSTALAMFMADKRNGIDADEVRKLTEETNA